MARARRCAGGISSAVLVAIYYFYTARLEVVREERRCKKVEAGGSRTRSGGERGGVC
jgi:hypothetical protein